MSEDRKFRYSDVGYIQVVKNLNIYLGITCNLYLAELIDKHQYWIDKEQEESSRYITDDGFFFVTKAIIEKDTGINKPSQTKLAEKLEKLKILETDIRGTVNRRKYFKINYEVLDIIINKIHEISIETLPRASEITSSSINSYKEKIKNITIDGVKAYKLNQSYSKEKEETPPVKNQIGVVKELNDPSLEIKLPLVNSLTTLKDNKKDNTKESLIINNKREEIKDISSHDDKDILYGENKEKEINDIPKSRKVKTYKKTTDILLQEEYQDIIDLFKEYDMKIQLQKESGVTNSLYKILSEIESGTNPFRNKKFKDGRNKKQGTKKKSYEKAIAYFDKKHSKRYLLSKLKKALDRIYLIRKDKGDIYFSYGAMKTVNTSSFLYDSFSQESFFLYFLINEPTLNKDYKADIQYDKVKEKFDKLNISYEKLNKVLYNNSEIVNKFSKQQKRELIFTTNNLHKWLTKNEKKLEQLGYTTGFKNLLSNIGLWLQTQNKVQSNYIEVGKPTWDWFNNWAIENLGLDYRKCDEVQIKRVAKKRAGKKVVSDFDIEQRAEEIMTNMANDDFKPYKEVVEIARKQLEQEIA